MTDESIAWSIRASILVASVVGWAITGGEPALAQQPTAVESVIKSPRKLRKALGEVHNGYVEEKAGASPGQRVVFHYCDSSQKPEEVESQTLVSLDTLCGSVVVEAQRFWNIYAKIEKAQDGSPAIVLPNGDRFSVATDLMPWGDLQGASPSGEVVFQRRAIGKCESQTGCMQEFGQYARDLGIGRIDNFRGFSVKPKL